MIEGAERGDEGLYTITVTNPAGEDRAELTVKIVGEATPRCDWSAAAHGGGGEGGGGDGDDPVLFDVCRRSRPPGERAV